MNIRIYDHSYHHVVSGGDVIAAEFARAWNAAGHTATVFTHPEAKLFFVSRGIREGQLAIASRVKTDYGSVLLASFAHTANATADALKSKQPAADLIFAGSWSLPDIIPAIIDKRKHPESVLAVGCYIFLVPPWIPAYGVNFLNRLVFYHVYLTGLMLTLLFSDVIWTASPVDAANMTKWFKKRAFPIRGGVDVTEAAAARRTASGQEYDAVFIGRFHPQKNIIELVRIWKSVAASKKDARLVIAGAGFQESAIRREITRTGLSGNITLLPPIDGRGKFSLLSKSRLFVSASHYDTGNLALDESLATGTPGIIYDLPKVSYPSGVIRVPPFDTPAFAAAILKLLSNGEKRNRLSVTGMHFAEKLDWPLQAKRALESLTKR